MFFQYTVQSHIWSGIWDRQHTDQMCHHVIEAFYELNKESLGKLQQSKRHNVIVKGMRVGVESYAKRLPGLLCQNQIYEIGIAT